MYILTKKLQDFCAAHRLGKGFPFRCRFLHGHNFTVEVTLGSEILNEYDMVMDFGDIKKLCDKWIQDNWDHATIVSASDTSLLKFLQDNDQRFFVIPANQNSTAEFLSRFLFEKFSEIIKKEVGEHIKLLKVKVCETEGSCAIWTTKQ